VLISLKTEMDIGVVTKDDRVIMRVSMTTGVVR